MTAGEEPKRGAGVEAVEALRARPGAREDKDKWYYFLHGMTSSFLLVSLCVAGKDKGFIQTREGHRGQAAGRRNTLYTRKKTLLVLPIVHKDMPRPPLCFLVEERN